MNLKKFLKPDRRKIVIFLVLSGFTLTLYSIVRKLDLYQMQNIYLTLTFGIIFFLPNFILNSILFFITFYYSSSIGPMEFGFLKESNEFKIISSVANVIGWVLSIFYWYILSCLIVWIYDKSKSRKVKKK